MAKTNFYFPLSATLEITNICNLECIHCYLDKTKPVKLEKNVCLDLIRQLYDLGCFNIVLTGGEVFLQKETLFSALQEAKRLDMKVTIITNGTLCTFEDLRLLKGLKLDNLHISVYGNSSDSYYQVTGAECDVSHLKAKILYAKQLGINVSVLSVGINCLFIDLIELQQWCKTNEVAFNLAYVLYGKENGDQETEPLNQEQMRTLIEQSEKQRILTAGKQLSHVQSSDFCAAGTRTICIAASGEVFPCSNWRVSVGSVFNNKLSDIWHRGERLQAVRCYSFGDLECAQCERLDFCPTCPGINYSSTGDAQTAAPELCKYAEVIGMFVESAKDEEKIRKL